MQLWLGWLLDDLGCRPQPGQFELFGITTPVLWLVIGAVTGAIALAATLVAWRLTRQGRADDAGGPQRSRRFIAATALALNLLLVGTILLGATAPLIDRRARDRLIAAGRKYGVHRWLRMPRCAAERSPER